MLLHSEIWLLLGSDAFTVPDLYCKVNVTLELAGINQSVYLREGSEFGSQLQKRHLCSLRRILGVKNSTTNWAVLRECGREPLQFFWFRASISFFNSMLDSNSKTLRRVLKADLHLASFDSSCWSASSLECVQWTAK